MWQLHLVNGWPEIIAERHCGFVPNKRVTVIRESFGEVRMLKAESKTAARSSLV
jgi:hypothetical protein